MEWDRMWTTWSWVQGILFLPSENYFLYRVLKNGLVFDKKKKISFSICDDASHSAAAAAAAFLLEWA
jgi:hypothetical protein